MSGEGAVMVSIRPKWVELIAARRKTVEVRKDAPKRLQAPFTCYIYQTRGKWACFLLRELGLEMLAERIEKAAGRVVGEFVCDEVMPEIVCGKVKGTDIFTLTQASERCREAACLSEKDLFEYSKGKELFGWHISNLKIYKRPRNIREFRGLCRREHYQITCRRFKKGMCAPGTGEFTITAPPQSWCYVEKAKFEDETPICQFCGEPLDWTREIPEKEAGRS